MTRIRILAPVCVVACVAVSWMSGAAAQQQQQRQQQAPARAQGTMPLETAWHQCLQWVDRTAPRTGENDNQRTAQFKACMTERGFTR
jgi:hypothetical protein